MCVTRREPSTRRRELDDQVESARDLLPDRCERHVDAGCEHKRLQAVQALARRVRVDRGERALVTGVHRLEHVHRLRASDLADDDAVGPHAQRVPDELADAHLALALDVRRAGLEADDVPLLEPELGRVLDRDDPLATRHERGQVVEQRRLARRRSRPRSGCSSCRGRTRRGTQPPSRSGCPCGSGRSSSAPRGRTCGWSATARRAPAAG